MFAKAPFSTDIYYCQVLIFQRLQEFSQTFDKLKIRYLINDIYGDFTLFVN